MAFTDTFVRRPVLSICVNLLILFVGLLAIDKLNVRQYPKSDSAVVIVTTPYIGASPELVRGFVTTPLERVIASADGIDYLESQSAVGLSTITAHLKLNFDTNSALTQIQSKISQVKNDLPRETEASSINVEMTDNRFAQMYLSFYSKDLDQNQITDYLIRVVQPQLTAVSGVQKADILGARTFAMRAWLKTDRMAALNITPTEVRDALTQNNYLSTLGISKGSMVSMNLITNTDLHSVDEFKQLVVHRVGNTVVRLGDVADVVLGAESYDDDVKFDGESATFMGLWVLPFANSVETIQNVRKVLPEIEKSLPPGLKLGIPYDGTKYINDAINEVIRTLIETICIVILVIYLFIGSFRGTLIPIVAIPLSLIGATIFMAMFGFTVNLLTLLAIVLAVGLVVDDAIVMLENIERHVQEGMTPFEAAIKGAQELIGPTIAMTITLATVYTPIAFQGGLTGALFREFALTLAGAVLISGIVALTLSPMMSSKFIRSESKSTRIQAWFNKYFLKLRTRYAKTLGWTLNNRGVVFSITVGFLICLIPFYTLSMKELAPREDQGVVFGIVQMSPNSTLEQSLLYSQPVHKVFTSQPEYFRSFEIISRNFGFSGMVLKSWNERKRTSTQIEQALWPEMSKIPGVRVIVTTPPPLPGGSDFPVEFVITSTDQPRQVYEYATKLVRRAMESGNFMFADSDLKFDQPQAEVVFDRDKVASMGLNLQKVGADLSTMLGGGWVNRFNIQGRSYKVIPQVERSDRLNPEQIKNYYVAGASNQLVPVSTFADVKETVEPRQLLRFQQLNSAKIQGAPMFGTSIDSALTFLENEARKILPSSYLIDYAGESRQLRKEGSTLVTTLIFAAVLIFLVLASQFESFRDPLIILLGSVPLALSGALLFPFFGATSVNIYSQVGLITLVGLVAKNAILIVEFANKLQEEGKEKIEAVYEAAITRFRPVLMTTVATIAGHFPLVLVSGAGAAARNSIGITLVTGMFIGTFLTLFVVPSIYSILARDHRHHKGAPATD